MYFQPNFKILQTSRLMHAEWLISFNIYCIHMTKTKKKVVKSTKRQGYKEFRHLIITIQRSTTLFRWVLINFSIPEQSIMLKWISEM